MQKDINNLIPSRRKGGLLAFTIVLGICLILLFSKSLNTAFVVFSNDGPLGGVIAAQNQMPGILTGLWQDLNWLGGATPTPSPTLSSLIRLVLPPVAFQKFFCPASLFILGVCAWFCFRQWRFSHLAAALGGLAAALSSHFFSTACWGVAAQVICVGMNFVAVGLLGSEHKSAARRWASVVLAGMAVGMSIMEGYDIGAIFSLFVAAFGVFNSLFREGSPARNAVLGVGRVVVVAVFAAFLSAHALDTLISTQIKGVATADPAAMPPAERWDQATQWSFPPHEILRVVIPGLFGYRMDTPRDMAFAQESFAAGNYWGRAGETPGWTENHNNPEWAAARPGAMPRFSGGGEYAGVLVVLVAIWAIAQSWRKTDSAFTTVERKHLWFWTAAAVISLLLAFGRYAPFYQFFYMLPYFHTIRNPAKFTHTFHFCLVILFAYGIEGLVRRYMDVAATSTRALGDHLKHWWEKAPVFDRRWIMACGGMLGASVVGYLIYAASKPSLERRIADVGFPEPALAAQMASFSVSAVGWFVLWLAVAVALMVLIVSGKFSGPRMKLGSVLLGLIIVVDLARANLPWIIYQDYTSKYATNPIIEFLRQKPFEHRVAMIPFPAPGQLSLFSDLYRLEWSQHHFQYYDIQALEFIQNPRPPTDQVMFERTFAPTGTNDLHKIPRRWQLTNTRYLLGPAGFVAQMNSELDPAHKRFKVVQPFNVVPKPSVSRPTKHEDLTAEPNNEGPYGIVEFTGALPRASLYYNWRVSTNDQETLNILSAKDFAPESAVLVADAVSAPVATNQPPTPVEFVSYAPKRIVLKAQPTAPAILLLNDKFAPSWQVKVNGKPAEMLRCNFIMRGVELTPGTHEVVFEFKTPMGGLYVSLAAILLALGLVGYLGFGPAGPQATDPEKKRAETSPQPSAKAS